MRIGIDTIEDGGRRIDAGPTDAWAVRAATTALEAPAATVTASLDLEVRAEVVFVSGTAQARASRRCDRCGEAVDLEVVATADLAYAPEPSGEQPTALGQGDLDMGWYHGGELDLEAALTEALALALPNRVRCTDVPACDTRTEALLEAGRSGPQGHPGFAALEDLVRD